LVVGKYARNDPQNFTAATIKRRPLATRNEMRMRDENEERNYRQRMPA